MSNSSTKNNVQNNGRGTISSFNVQEENRSEIKFIPYGYQDEEEKKEERFEVIREENRESLYGRPEEDYRQNSDFKRFTMDDEFNSRNLRMGGKAIKFGDQPVGLGQ